MRSAISAMEWSVEQSIRFGNLDWRYDTLDTEALKVFEMLQHVCAELKSDSFGHKADDSLMEQKEVQQSVHKAFLVCVAMAHLNMLRYPLPPSQQSKSLNFLLRSNLVTPEEKPLLKRLMEELNSGDAAVNAVCEEIITTVWTAQREVQRTYNSMHMCSQESECNLTRFREYAFEGMAQAMYDFAAVVCFFLCMLTVYRSVPTVFAVLHEPNGSKRKKCLLLAGEIPIDILYFVAFLMVILCLKNALQIVMDMLILLPRQPSFENARLIVWYYFRQICADIGEVVLFIATWRTYKLLMATAVWGAFSPAVLILETGVMDEANKCLVVVVALFTCTFIYGCPFLAVYAVKSVKGIYAFYGMLLFVLIVSAVLCAVFRAKKSPGDSGAIVLVPVQVLSLSWSYVVTSYLWLLMESLHLIALFYPDSWFLRILFLRFDIGQPFPLGFYVAVAFTVMHYILASLPVVLEDMLEWHQKGEVSNWRAWLFASEFVTANVFVFIIYNLCLPSAQSLQNSEIFNQPYLMGSFLLLIFYVPTALLKDRKRTAASANMLSVHWDELARMTLQIIITAWVGSTAFTPKDSDRAIAGIIFGMVGLATLAIYMLRVSVCSVAVIAQYRLVLFGAVVAVAITTITLSFPVLAYVDIALGFVTVAIMYLLQHLAKKRVIPDSVGASAGEAQKMLLDLEEELYAKGRLGYSWTLNGRQRLWKDDVCQSLSPGVLAKCAMALEENIRVHCTEPLFLKSRVVWRKKAQSIAEREDAVATEWITRRRERTSCVGCCESEGDDDTEREITSALPLQKRVEVIMEVIQGLRNSITDKDPPVVKTYGPEPAEERSEWACQKCTFLNAVGDYTCAMCGELNFHREISI